ncbi:MAG: hypothetical protein JRJ85_05205 [Deltaproteobacteria bacterium]|nr:hypothetical protein [Deltaproteobacteria bacterium]
MSNDLVSKDAYTWAKLKSLSERRGDQSSFHIYSEAHLRSQIFNLNEGQQFSEANYEGNLLITGIKGTADIFVDGDTIRIEKLDQILINPKISFSLVAKSNTSLQFVWSPPFEMIEYEIEDL